MLYISFHYRYKKQIIIISIILILLSISGYFIYINIPKKEEIKISKEEPIKNTKPEKVEEKKYKVDIKGQINNPGIYEVVISSRVIDVINLAGGLTVNADTSVINLSKKVLDEMIIIVYSKEEVTNFKKTKEIEQQVQNQCVQKDENSLKNDACISSNNNISTNKIWINNATKEELMTLPGIGESKAKDIIDYRTKNGPFKKLEDLKNIPGIGENVYNNLKENITL